MSSQSRLFRGWHMPTLPPRPIPPVPYPAFTCMPSELVATACLDHTFLLSTGADLGVTFPSNGLEALRQVRVGEVVAGVDPVGVHSAEVLDVKLDETAGKLGGVAELLGEGVGLELELAGDDVHQVLDDSVHRGESAGEEYETDDDGEFLVEAVGIVQRPVVDEDGEQSEDVEDVNLRLC